MRITKITARNFKGLSFDQDLAPVTMITGPNFSGKTARVAALRLLLLGHLPEIGGTPRAAFGLSSGREMTVGATNDAGQSFSRSFSVRGDSIRSEKEMPDDLEQLGPLATMLDPNQYFALSDRERAAYVFKQMRSGDGMINLESIKVGAALACQNSADMIDRIFAAGEGLQIQDAVDAIIEAAAEEESLAKKAATRMAKTAEGTTQMNAQEATGTAPRPIEELERLRDEAQNDLEAVLKRDMEIREWRTAARRARELRAQIESVESDEQRSAAASTEAELERLRVALEEAPPDSSRKAELQGLVNKIGLETRDLMRDIGTADKQVKAIENLLAELHHQNQCPYCGASGTQWRHKREAELKADAEKLSKQIEEALEAKEKVLRAGEAANEALRAIVAAENRRAKLIAEQQELLIKLNAIKVKSVQADGMRQSLAAMGDVKDDAAILRAEGEASRLRAETSNRLASIHAEIKRAVAQQGEMQRIARAQQERDEAEADQKKAAGIAAYLRGARAAMVENAFLPLLARANALFGDMMRTPIEFRDGEVGTTRAGVWVSHKVMSGTEQVLVYAAISAALASRSPMRIMVVDEMGRLDAENAAKMIGCVHRALTNGAIDQFVGVDTRTAPYREASSVFNDFQLVEISP